MAAHPGWLKSLKSFPIFICVRRFQLCNSQVLVLIRITNFFMVVVQLDIEQQYKRRWYTRNILEEMKCYCQRIHPSSEYSRSAVMILVGVPHPTFTNVRRRPWRPLLVFFRSTSMRQ